MPHQIKLRPLKKTNQWSHPERSEGSPQQLDPSQLLGMRALKNHFNALKFKYVYGPVESWRMGKSLGIDPLSDKVKICNLNCIYCQLGQTHILTNEKKVYIGTVDVLKEVRDFFNLNDPQLTEGIDYITFSGRGEPTLAENLGEMIRGVRQMRDEEVAVITNATLLYLPQVQRNLHQAHLVMAKLDACNETSFKSVDKHCPEVSFEKTLEGLKDFKEAYLGKLVIQIMFVEENMKYAKFLADIVRDIAPDEVQINTPLRPSAAKPLSQQDITLIKSYFAGIPAVTVYERERKETIPFNQRDTILRHGNYLNQT